MIETATIESVCERIAGERPVSQVLPEGGEVFIGRQMPYICVYRYKELDPSFARLLRAQASYLIVREELDISCLLEEIAQTVADKLFAFLVIELWPVRKASHNVFEIFSPEKKAPATVKALKEGFDQVREIAPRTSTKVTVTPTTHPDHLGPILSDSPLKESNHVSIGVAVPALYRNTDATEYYSLFYRKFHRHFSETIKKAAYEFIRVQSSHHFDHYLMLGKPHVDQRALEADRKLAEISGRLSFLLNITPVDSAYEWERFKKSKFTVEPIFDYRLIALDPEKEKRRLFNIRLDKIDDPTIAHTLREKRLEIEKQLTMLEERGTDNFRHLAMSLYGRTEERVVDVAKAILRKYPVAAKATGSRRLNCHEFAEHAQQEIDYYQKLFPARKLSLEIREDITGLMVSKGKLMLSDRLAPSHNRCDALIQHEVGTHILTYCNGKSQSLRQMHAGLANYDGLQEGLAVLAEYLVGGLTVNRMRILAGRVMAVEAMTGGSGFIETFRLLKDKYKFNKKKAYTIAMRVHRGGGLPKDAAYLAGLVDVLEYLRNGGNLEILYAGKFSIRHIGLIEELLHRGILKNPITPRFLERESVKYRLQKVRDGLNVVELLEESSVESLSTY